MMVHFKQLASEENNVIFQQEWSHIRCVAHVLNLVVKEVLNGFTSSKKDEEKLGFSALPLDKLGRAIRKIRKSPQKIQQYHKVCEMNQLPPKTPIIDVSTRWNSTFLMLDHAVQYQAVINILSAQNDEWASLRLNDDEWNRLKQLSTDA